MLRGFCTICSKDYEYDLKSKGNSDFWCVGHKPKIEWVLSPQQMKIIYESDDFGSWYGDQKSGTNITKALWKILESDPFLVAKILKEAEK